jgi:5-methyltetrahydropteroyltriglutamate--homocysteine methyltransferase
VSRWPRPFATQLVGSYSKPGWLLDKGTIGAEAWSAPPALLAEAQDDTVRLAVYDQERAGLDLLADGEGRRLNFARHFTTAWEGVDAERLGTVEYARTGGAMRYPRVVGPLRWPGPRVLDDLRFLKRLTDRPVKMAVVGPLTAAARLADEHYRDPEALLLACADVVNAELRALDAEGCDLLQLDEPVLYTNLGPFRPYVAAALDRALGGLHAPVAVHVCYGYAFRFPHKEADPAYAAALEMLAAHPRVDWISLEYAQPGHTAELLRSCGAKGVILGVLDLATEQAERPETIAARVRDALAYVPPARLHLAPDCGMWHLPRPVALAKLQALTLAAALLRAEVGE